LKLRPMYNLNCIRDKCLIHIETVIIGTLPRKNPLEKKNNSNFECLDYLPLPSRWILTSPLIVTNKSFITYYIL